MKNKKITINDLALMMQKGFKSVNEKMDAGFVSVRAETKAGIEELAVMVGKGFDGVDKRFEGVDENFKGIHQEIKEFRTEVNDRFLNVNARLDTIEEDATMMRDDRHRIKLLEDDVAVLKRK